MNEQQSLGEYARRFYERADREHEKAMRRAAASGSKELKDNA